MIGWLKRSAPKPRFHSVIVWDILMDLRFEEIHSKGGEVFFMSKLETVGGCVRYRLVYKGDFKILGDK